MIPYDDRSNRSFKFIKEYKEDGLCTGNSYQYEAKKHADECKIKSDDCLKTNSTTVTHHGMLPQSAFGLKLGLHLMPVSVGVNASPVSIIMLKAISYEALRYHIFYSITCLYSNFAHLTVIRFEL